MDRIVITVLLTALQGISVCPFFLAGGWKYESANDTCALKTAKDSVLLLSSSDEFQSRLDSTLEDCNMEIEELKTAERQLVAGTNWRFRMSNQLKCKRNSNDNNLNSIHITSVCYEIQSFIPLPCSNDDPSLVCNTIRMKVTGFKQCAENNITKTKANLRNDCL